MWLKFLWASVLVVSLMSPMIASVPSFLSASPRKEAGVRVAFLADQGLGYQSGQGALDVLRMLKREQIDLLVVAGDFDYESLPDSWEAMLTAQLGQDFPIIAALGNHDVINAPGPAYQARLQERLGRTPDVRCRGIVAVAQVCEYRGMAFYLWAVGLDPAATVDALQHELGIASPPWRVCVWHYNHEQFQVGRKPTEAPMPFYEACRLAGAFVVNGHNHAYGRTVTLVGTAPVTVAARVPRSMGQVGRGRFFVMHSGLGGASMYPINPERLRDPWWAAAYDGDYGAVICDFFVRRASCVFRTRTGRVIDRFTIQRLPASRKW